ncbi:MAG: hypothetical protein ACU833_14330 [Gammaproteobacteria bacterium]
MNFNAIGALFMAVSIGGCASNGSNQPVQHTGTGTLVINKIEFNGEAYIREAVKNECRLPEKLTRFIGEYAAGRYARIVTDSSEASRDAQVLDIEIVEALGAPGGAWSGGKMVMVKGSLTQQGAMIGDFKGRRVSGGGLFAEYKGTCSILGRCVKALGKDIAAWLEHPGKQSVLGDM